MFFKKGRRFVQISMIRNEAERTGSRQLGGYIQISLRFRESTSWRCGERGIKWIRVDGKREQGPISFTTHEIQFQSSRFALSGDKQKLMHFCRITTNTPWSRSSFSSVSFCLSAHPLCRSFFLPAYPSSFLFIPSDS